MIKVLVVHQHEESQGSTILGVFRDSDRGRAMAERVQKRLDTGRSDVVEIQECEITDAILLSNARRAALLALKTDAVPTPEELREFPWLVSHGYVVATAKGGAILYAITTTGHSLCDLGYDGKEP